MMAELPLNSRYRTVPERTTTLASGEEVRFLGRRVIPDLDKFRPLDRHRVVEGDRIDQIAGGGYGDPLLYWRIVDASGEADPFATCRPVGRVLIVPLPIEVTGNG
jgi:hypothetical protein